MRTMKTRALGGGLEVSALGLGCMGLSVNYGQPANGRPCPGSTADPPLRQEA